MTSDVDPASWLLSRQALDQRETKQALAAALPDTIVDGFREYGLEGDTRSNVADDMAIELARAGLALVRIVPEPAGDFFSRKTD